MTKVIYYTTASGNNPTRKFIESLQNKQRRKVIRILTYIQEYGLITVIPHIKKQSGTKLWEIRILGEDNIRILYVAVMIDSILLLHGFIKKSQETPQKEINTALDRFTDWLSDQETIDG